MSVFLHTDHIFVSSREAPLLSLVSSSYYVLLTL